MSFTFDRRAFERLVNGPAGKAILTAAATKIRDDARSNARSIGSGAVKRDSSGKFVAGSRLTNAIQYEVGEDGEGAYADVGYAKHHPGFVLWFAEVGTRNQPAQPHLRPAVKPNQL